MKKSNQYSMDQAMRRKMAERIHVADMVEVISFYPEDMTVDVKPLVMGIREECFVSRPPVMKVPAATLSGNGMFIRPWYREGDIGIIVYLDYDTDNVFVSGGIRTPDNRLPYRKRRCVYWRNALRQCAAGKLSG